jgi:branched-chain amino acid transport system substrate-binding protein
LKAATAIVEKAGSTETEALIAAAKGIEDATPFGPITFRAADHQSTMGAYVGRTALRDGKGVMVDFRYVDGADVLPSEEEAKALRPE